MIQVCSIILVHISEVSGEREASTKSIRIGNFISFHHWNGEKKNIVYDEKQIRSPHIRTIIFIPTYHSALNYVVYWQATSDENTMLW